MQFPKMIGNNSKPNFHLITEMQELTPLAISRIFFCVLFADSHLGNTKEYSLKRVVEFNTHVFSRLLSIEQNSEVLVYNGISHNNFVVNKL